MRSWLTSIAVWLICSAAVFAGPKVEIIVAEKASPLEQRAGTEVAEILKRLYQAETTAVATPSGKLPAIFIGNPATNPALDFAKADWPKLSEQGHLVKSTKHRDQPALLIGGGSPAATYWAAREYAHHLGVRTMLYGDLDPISPPEFSLAGIDVKLEPDLRTRAWKIGYFGPASFAGWSQADQVRFVNQLAKLKFNELVIRVSAGEPFIEFAAAGIRRKEGKFWSAGEYPIAGDTAGRSAFAGAKFFENPDLVQAKTERERIDAAQKILRGVIAAAHRQGMKVTLFIEPYDLPPEYDRRKVYADSELAKACAQATVREYLRTYPEIDALMIGLDDVYPHTPSFFAEAGIWQRPDKSQVTPKAFNHYSREQPAVWLKTVPQAQDVMFQEIYDLEDLDAGKVFAPRSPQHSVFDCQLAPALKTLPRIACALNVGTLQCLRDQRWQGFMATADESLGCQDLNAYLMSRNSFGANLSAEAGCDLMLTPVCGTEVHTRVSKALTAVELITSRLQVRTSYDLSADVWLSKYAAAEPAPVWFADVKDAFLSAMNEMYRANTRARDGSRSYTLYLARQFEFGFEYVNCLQAIRNAGVAKKEGDKEKHLAELEKAIDSINGACNALAAVARSQSDRGLIAKLNAEVYRPLLKELEKADAEE